MFDNNNYNRCVSSKNRSEFIISDLGSVGEADAVHTENFNDAS